MPGAATAERRGSADLARRSVRSPCVSGGSVEDAIAMALQAHRGQTYAATDQPFILHPLRVMLRFEDPLLQTVAVLHDTVEDTDVSLESLCRAGFRAAVVRAVDALTRR